MDFYDYNSNRSMKRERGQTILILVLVMTVALAIGISVTQRSLSDISTSTKVEQSSRAFSAAEAGIDKAIQNNTAITTSIPLGNNSAIASVTVNENVPGPGEAFEYPSLQKEEMAHVWLADPDDLTEVYAGSSLGIYWGDPNITATGDKPAIAITVVYQTTAGAYKSKKYYYDELLTRNNRFPQPDSCTLSPIITSEAPGGKTFYCKEDIDVSAGAFSPDVLDRLILVRARLLYNEKAHPLAVRPIGGNLPYQGKKFLSTGVSGDTTRKVQVLREEKVVPPYFDYGIFSMAEIDK